MKRVLILTTSDDEIDKILYGHQEPISDQPKYVIEEKSNGRGYRIWIEVGNARVGPDGLWWERRSWKRAERLAKRELENYLGLQRPVKRWEGTL